MNSGNFGFWQYETGRDLNKHSTGTPSIRIKNYFTTVTGLFSKIEIKMSSYIYQTKK